MLDRITSALRALIRPIEVHAQEFSLKNDPSHGRKQESPEKQRDHETPKEPTPHVEPELQLIQGGKSASVETETASSSKTVAPGLKVLNFFKIDLKRRVSTQYALQKYELTLKTTKKNVGFKKGMLFDHKAE